jgi:hypothetical protein
MLAGGEEVSVKIAAGIATALALICAAGLAARVAGSSAASVSRNMVVVTTTADVVNGNTSSIAALNRKPGRDGISLREALLAADRTGGSATVYILFSHRLNGKTIKVRSELPPIHRDHLVLEGIAPNGSPARVTLDWLHAPRVRQGGELLLVQASEVTVRWLTFASVYYSTQLGALDVIPGRSDGTPPSTGPLKIANVQILDNVFATYGGGITVPAPVAQGVFIGNSYVANTHVSGVTIARNTFLGPSSDGVLVGTDNSGSTAQGVVIEDNTFDGNEFAVELGEAGNSPRQEGTQIIHNTITGGSIGITLNESATNGVIDNTLIQGNVISGVQGNAFNLDAAAYDPSLPGMTGSDVISNTQIINNAIHANYAGQAGIRLSGGNIASSSPSRVSAVTIENDTFVNEQQGSLFVANPGAPGNQITDVTVRNSILYEPSAFPPIAETGPVPNQRPDVLTNSLISGPGWAGQNGNITGDPKFVDEAHGDYHLAPGSPAINAGTTIGAPSYDLDGARRDAQPDIGAFEFGALPRPLLTVTAEQRGGNGTVTSSPAGINCGTACSARFEPGTTVKLTAKPDRGSKFLGWSQPCSRKARCTVSLKSARSITARFAP